MRLPAAVAALIPLFLLVPLCAQTSSGGWHTLSPNASYGKYPYHFAADPRLTSDALNKTDALNRAAGNTSLPSKPAYSQAALSTPPQPLESSPQVYVLAFHDGSLHPAVSYRVEGATLYYITPSQLKDASRPPAPGAKLMPLSSIIENRAPLSSVDLEFSAQINRARNVEFKMP